MTDDAGQLAALRQEVTDLTVQIVALLNQRASIALRIAAAKQRLGRGAVRDPQREAELLRMLTARSGGPLSAAAIRRIVQTIMDESSKLQADASGLALDEGHG